MRIFKQEHLKKGFVYWANKKLPEKLVKELFDEAENRTYNYGRKFHVVIKLGREVVDDTVFVRAANYKQAAAAGLREIKLRNYSDKCSCEVIQYYDVIFG